MIEQVSLNALKFFYYVAYFGSVTIAADKLHVTQSAVSKQIKNLEHRLNVALFDRVNKSLKLTESGKTLYACCEQVFKQLDSCLLELQQPMNQTPLVLSCEPTLSMKWLIPRLANFNADDFGFEIVLLTAGGQVDFKAKGIDVAIRRNDFAWGKHIYAHKLIDEAMVAVCNPNLPPKPVLFLSSSRPQLERFITKAYLGEVASFEKRYLEHFYLCVEVALAGLGTAWVSKMMVEKELETGLLVSTVPPVPDGSAYYLLSDRAFAEDTRKMAFLEWLEFELKSFIS